MLVDCTVMNILEFSGIGGCLRMYDYLGRSREARAIRASRSCHLILFCMPRMGILDHMDSLHMDSSYTVLSHMDPDHLMAILVVPPVAPDSKDFAA